MVGKAVLCLAGGGGQQSAPSLLGGARNRIGSIEEQLQGDRQAADHYQVNIQTSRRWRSRDFPLTASTGVATLFTQLCSRSPQVFREVAQVCSQAVVINSIVPIPLSVV
jgi:hypothetical protein